MAKDLVQLIIRATDQTGAAFDSAARNVQNLSGGVSKLNGLLAGIGVSLSAGAFAGLIKQTVEAQGALDDLKDTTALTVETLSSLQQTARIGGHSFEMVTGTASKFAKSVAEAAGGNKELLRSFDALGISQERLRTAKFDDLYTEFAAKIANAENKTYAIAYATDLAGKSAAQALPFFKDLAETGLEQARVTTQQAAAADQLQKQLGRMGNSLDGIKNKFAADIVPTMSRFIQDLDTAYKAAGNLGGALQSLAGLSEFGRTPAEQIRNINIELEKTQRLQRSQLGNGLLSGPLLGMRESRLMYNQEVARAMQRQEALRIAEGMDTGDVWSRRAASKARTVLRAPGDGNTDNAGAQLIAQLQGQLAELNGEASEVDKVIRKLTDGTKEYTLGVQASALAIAGEIDERKRQQAEIKAAVEAYDRAEATQRAADKVLADFNQTQSETLQNLQFETELLRLNDVEREQAIALRKLENEYRKATIRLEGEEMEAYAERMRQTRAIYEANKDALPGMVRSNVEGRQLIEAQKRAADESRRVWERFHDDIGRGLTDALMRGFENGKSFGENFWESLKNTAKTTILRPIVQFAVSPITGAITAAMGGVMPGTAGASTGGAGGGGNLLGSLLGGGNPMGWIMNAGGIAGSAGAYASALGLSSSAVGSQAAMLAAQTAEFGVAGLASTASSAGAGAMSGLISAAPYAAAALAAYSLLKSKKTPAVLTGKDLPAGLVSYSGGLSGTMYGNDANQGYRWAGEEWSGVFASEIRETYDAIERAANALGYDGSRVRGITATVSTGSFMDASEALPRVLEQLTSQLASEVIPNLSTFARAGETAAQTLGRLTAEAQQASLGRMQAALGLADNTRDLWLSDLSPLSPEARLKEAGLRYNETLGLARGGDANAIAGLSGMSRSYLEQARGFYASGTGYADIFSQVQGDVRGLVNDTLVDQAIAFADIAGSLENVADLLGNVDKRIANQLEAVFKERDIADEAYKKAILQQNAELISQVRDLTQQLARVAA